MGEKQGKAMLVLTIEFFSFGSCSASPFFGGVCFVCLPTFCMSDLCVCVCGCVRVCVCVCFRHSIVCGKIVRHRSCAIQITITPVCQESVSQSLTHVTLSSCFCVFLPRKVTEWGYLRHCFRWSCSVLSVKGRWKQSLYFLKKKTNYICKHSHFQRQEQVKVSLSQESCTVL